MARFVCLCGLSPNLPEFLKTVEMPHGMRAKGRKFKKETWQIESIKWN